MRVSRVLGYEVGALDSNAHVIQQRNHIAVPLQNVVTPC
jgi:hypothetical protein